MFSYKAFLKLGEYTGSDFMSLTKEGYELSNCNYVFYQGVDDKGKASTNVKGGSISLMLPMLPPKVLIEWALNSKQYKNGAIVVLDANHLPQERVIFKNAACIDFGIDYTLKSQSYIFTKMELRAESLIIGNGIFFDNDWIK